MTNKDPNVIFAETLAASAALIKQRLPEAVEISVVIRNRDGTHSAGCITVENEDPQKFSPMGGLGMSALNGRKTVA